MPSSSRTISTRTAGTTCAVSCSTTISRSRRSFSGCSDGPDHPRLGLLKALSPGLAPLVKRRYEIEPERVAHSREVIQAALRRVEAEAGPAGYLVGDSFTVADLTVASILALIVVPPEFPYRKLPPDERAAEVPEFRASLNDLPGFKWVEDMYARHRGTSAEVEAD